MIKYLLLMAVSLLLDFLYVFAFERIVKVLMILYHILFNWLVEIANILQLFLFLLERAHLDFQELFLLLEVQWLLIHNFANF